jgi:endonuclease I
MDTWDALMVLDEDPDDPARVVVVYSGFSLLKSSQTPGTLGSWNREHLWPQSYGLNALSSNSRAKTDLFNLWAAEGSVNSSRGNKFYDYSTAPVTNPALAPGTTYDFNSWEPRDADKGAAARAVFYMAVRYEGTDPDVPDLELAETPDAALYRFGNLTTLLAWNRQFPVTPAERLRNQRIYATYQHNRNPFIDRPENADMVFLGLTPVQAWKNVRFTASELGDPSIGGDLADPDQDGISNLLEYACARDPRQPDTTAAMAVSLVSANSTSAFDAVFQWNRFASDVTFTFEGSTDLQTWSAVNAVLTDSTLLDFATGRATARIVVPSAPYFVRLRASR